MKCLVTGGNVKGEWGLAEVGGQDVGLPEAPA